MDRDTIRKEEKIDETIEGIIRKINSTIMLFQEHYKKLDTNEVLVEAKRLEAWRSKLNEIEAVYNNEMKTFQDDINSKNTPNEMKNCEIHILESLREIIKTLKSYVQPLSRLIEDSRKGLEIKQEYNALIETYNRYIDNQQKLMKLIEKDKIIEFRQLQNAS